MTGLQREFAYESLVIFSFLGSHLSVLPVFMAMLLRWQMTAEWWPMPA